MMSSVALGNKVSIKLCNMDCQFKDSQMVCTCNFNVDGVFTNRVCAVLKYSHEIEISETEVAGNLSLLMYIDIVLSPM